MGEGDNKLTKHRDITAVGCSAEAEKPEAEDRITAAVVIAILSFLCAVVILLTRPPACEEKNAVSTGAFGGRAARRARMGLY